MIAVWKRVAMLVEYPQLTHFLIGLFEIKATEGMEGNHNKSPWYI